MGQQPEQETRRAATRETALKMMGLVVLLSRAGGTTTFSQADYDEILERHGGLALMAVHIEVASIGGGQPKVELTLVRKPPANAELVS